MPGMRARLGTRLGRSAGLLVTAGGGSLLPFSDSFTRADGAIGNGWTGATWTISGNKAVNTPTLATTGGPLNDGNLVANGGFGADSDWTKGGNWTIGGNVASKTPSATVDALSQLVLTANTWYRCDWTITAMAAGQFNARFGGALVLGAPRTLANTYADTECATAATAGIRANTAANGSVDNVSFKTISAPTLFCARDLGAANVDVSVKVTRAAGLQAGLVLCLDSTSNPQNFIIAIEDGDGNVRLDQCLAGAYTPGVVSGAVAYADTRVLRVVKVGTTATVYYNAILVGSGAVNAGIAVNTQHGLFSTGNGNSFDDFTAVAA